MIVGISKAKELVYTGAIINSIQALEIKLVDKVSSDIEREVVEFAELISQNAPIGISLAKKALDFSQEQSL